MSTERRSGVATQAGRRIARWSALLIEPTCALAVVGAMIARPGIGAAVMGSAVLYSTAVIYVVALRMGGTEEKLSRGHAWNLGIAIAIPMIWTAALVILMRGDPGTALVVALALSAVWLPGALLASAYR